MKRRRTVRSVLAAVLMTAAGALFAQPSLAVIDAVLEEGLDPAIRVPITEKIIEQAVASGKYLVLDRANVTQVLEEKEFQFSGMVKDTEIKQAGEYLGADFVGAARVSKVGETYFISAKIIDVETGAIVAQASAEKKGQADVVFELANTVGTKLMGGRLNADQEAVLLEPGTLEEEKAEARERRLFAPTEKTEGAKSHVVANYLYPQYFGTALDIIDTNHEFDFGADWWSPTYGVDIHYLQVFLRYFYVSASISYMLREFESDFDYYDDFDIIDLKAHVGGVFSPFPNLQAYGGLGVGFGMITLSDYWYYLGYGLEYASETGVSINAEIGVDYVLFGFLAVGARLSLAMIPSLTNWEAFTWNESLGYFGIQIGAGIAY